MTRKGFPIFLKYVMDKVVAFVLLIILLPVMLLVLAAILLSDGRPVFFRQTRPGQHEKSFELIKFRTMKSLADANGNLLPDEDRLTGVGKWLRKLSLDELPQLLNVLKGDMSMVGPRPLLMEYLPLYDERQKRRHLVRPGITGWAQVNGRNTVSWQDKFEMDVWYVDHWSLALDFKVLGLTLIKVLKREGISREGMATVEKFIGNN